MIQHAEHTLAWLLEETDPGVRYLALRDLMHSSRGDSELASARKKAHRQGPIAQILARMNKAGYFVKPGTGYSPKYKSTVWSLILLAQLGASVKEDERIKLASDYILDHTLTSGGQFCALASGSPAGTIDCLQGNLCWALTELGVADPRLNAAYEWMARSVTGEGVAPATQKSAAVRYYAYNCGPLFACGANSGLPCAWGGVKIMLAFSRLPHQKQTPLIKKAIQKGVEFFLGIDPLTADYPRGSDGRPNSSWWKFGFPVFYISDVLQIAEALVSLGYKTDPRLKHLLDFIGSKQDKSGAWLLEHDYPDKTWVNFGPKRKPNKWVTLRAMRVLQV